METEQQQQQQRPHDLEYQPPRQARYGEVAADLIPWLGGATTIVGLVTWLTAFAGVDDSRQMNLGMLITGFGFTWWILGIILRVLVFKRD